MRGRLYSVDIPSMKKNGRKKRVVVNEGGRSSGVLLHYQKLNLVLNCLKFIIKFSIIKLFLVWEFSVPLTFLGTAMGIGDTFAKSFINFASCQQTVTCNIQGEIECNLLTEL